jgi:7-cyano-7-deazaguanine synthase
LPLTKRDSDEKRAVVLLSGGLDSTTVLAYARSKGFRCYCLSFSYGQKQVVELQKAELNATKYGAEKHLVLRLDLDKIGGSALTSELAVPKKESLEVSPADKLTEEAGEAIPVTYVPGRNSIFLSHAMAWAEVVGAFDIFIGVNVMDYSGYPDCRPEYLAAFEKMANLGTKAGVTSGRTFVIHAPLLHMRKKEIIELGTSLGVDYAQTHSCYDPNPQGEACGHCEACLLRLKGFADAGHHDPAAYHV